MEECADLDDAVGLARVRQAPKRAGQSAPEATRYYLFRLGVNALFMRESLVIHPRTNMEFPRKSIARFDIDSRCGNAG